MATWPPFYRWCASFLLLSTLKSLLLNHNDVCSACFPWGMDCSCASRWLLLSNLQHSQAPLSFMNALHGITHSWTLSVIKLALLKFKVFVLLLVFCVLSRILNCTVLQPFCPASAAGSSPQCIGGTWGMTCAPLCCFLNKYPGNGCHLWEQGSVGLRLPWAAKIWFR